MENNEEIKTEYEKAQDYVNEIMYQDVYHSIKYDEWSAREYGEDKVDTFDTAMALYEKGYRREIDVLEKLLIELSLCDINSHIEEDMLDDFYNKISQLKDRLIKMKVKYNMETNDIIKIKSACVKCSLKNTKSEVLATGFSHSDCYTYLGNAHGWYPQINPDQYNTTEGFICTDGKFVDRMTAMKIAKEANQLDNAYKDENYPLLYSYMVNYRMV